MLLKEGWSVIRVFFPQRFQLVKIVTISKFFPPAQSEDSDAAPPREEDKPMKAAKFVSTLFSCLFCVSLSTSILVSVMFLFGTYPKKFWTVCVLSRSWGFLPADQWIWIWNFIEYGQQGPFQGINKTEKHWNKLNTNSVIQVAVVLPGYMSLTKLESRLEREEKSGYIKKCRYSLDFWPWL